MHKRKEPETSSLAKNMVQSGPRPPMPPPGMAVLALEAPNISPSRSLRWRRAGGRSGRGGTARSGGDTISGRGGRSGGDTISGRGGRSGGDTISGRGGRSGGDSMPGRGGRSGGVSGRGGRSGRGSMPGRGDRSGGDSMQGRGGSSSRGGRSGGRGGRGRGRCLRLPTKQQIKLLLVEKAIEIICADLATVSMRRESSSTSMNNSVALTPEKNIADQGLPGSNHRVLIRQSEADETEAVENAPAPEPEASAQADPSIEPTGSGKADKAKLSLKSLKPIN